MTNSAIEYPLSNYLAASLPPLGGGTPPERCPICGRGRIPPECDDGWPPPEQWVYFCEGSYVSPEDPDAARVWDPCKLCGEVPTEDALAWLRDRCRREPRLVSAGAALARAVGGTPEWVAAGASLLFVGLPKISEAQTPEHCPVCGADGHRFSPSIHKYECDAHYTVTSERYGPDGKLVPASWGPLFPCGRPPVATVLRVLRARNEPEWKAICEEVLAALTAA